MRTYGAVRLRAEKVRQLCHACLDDSQVEPSLWGMVPRYRQFFQEHAADECFEAVMDGDVKIWVNLRRHIESQLFFHEMQEGDRGLVRLLKRLLRPGMVFLDAGAHIGAYSLWAAKRLGPAGQVYAFEPASEAYALLQKNIALNRFHSIRSFSLGLSDRSGEGFLQIPEHSNKGMATLHPEDGSGRLEKVSLVELDSFARGEDFRKLDIVKMDLEGHELSALRGMRSLLIRNQPLVACEAAQLLLQRAGESRKTLAAFFRELGYQDFGIREDGRLMPDSEPMAHENRLFAPPSARQWLREFVREEPFR